MSTKTKSSRGCLWVALTGLGLILVGWLVALATGNARVLADMVMQGFIFLIIAAIMFVIAKVIRLFKKKPED